MEAKQLEISRELRSEFSCSDPSRNRYFYFCEVLSICGLIQRLPWPA
jgi:hypothetical protein